MEKRMRIITSITVLFCILWAGNTGSGMPQVEPPIAQARTIAMGIPGAGAVARVGNFLDGAVQFAPQTASGQILDPNRLLVASSSNFGATIWLNDPGTILSIDPRVGTGPLLIPEKFAVGGGQASALDGAVRVFTSNHSSFVNSILNPEAVTQILPAVSVPTGIAIDNRLGQVAISSSVGVHDGEGWESIVNFQGRPFKGPAAFAGGVFAGARTNRDPLGRFGGGLMGGSMGTALMGLSIDGRGHNVFAVTNGDGSVAQVHLEMGVDGLIQKDFLGPYSGSARAQESWGAGGVMDTRGGLLFQAQPERLLFICDPSKNWILVYVIHNAGLVFQSIIRQYSLSPALSAPIDMTPVQFATTGPVSNTTLASRSDLYVANRGNGTIVRLRQNGDVVAVRRLQVESLGVIGPGWVNGIGQSNDGQSLFITLTGPISIGGRVYRGLLISIPAF